MMSCKSKQIIGKLSRNDGPLNQKVPKESIFFLTFTVQYKERVIVKSLFRISYSQRKILSVIIIIIIRRRRRRRKGRRRRRITILV